MLKASQAKLVVAVGLLICSPAGAQLRLKPCTFEGEPVQCGTLRVAEDPTVADARRLELSIAVARAKGRGEPREPLFILKGGPGERATESIVHVLVMFEHLRGDRDLVLLDQRGTGGQPTLTCEVAEGTFLVPQDPQRCLDELSSKADLRQYTTEQFVDDLETARQALGYERISLWAGSYGTRAAYRYAKKYPEHVESLVLIAPAPIKMPLLNAFDEDGRAALDALVSDCGRDRACGRAFPDLRRDLQIVRAGMTPSERLGLQALQYSSSTFRSIPLLISRAANGDPGPLKAAMNAVREQLVSRLTVGLHLAVVCSEDLPLAARPPATQSVLSHEYERACRDWPRAPLPDDFHAVVRIDKPALLITGEWDPVTSPRWARVAAEQFTRAQVVVIPREGHILDRFDSCIAAMTREFLDSGTADSACVRKAPRMRYALPR